MVKISLTTLSNYDRAFYKCDEMMNPFIKGGFFQNFILYYMIVNGA